MAEKPDPAVKKRDSMPSALLEGDLQGALRRGPVPMDASWTHEEGILGVGWLAKPWKVRSRPYPRRFLQQDFYFAAFFKVYTIDTIDTLLHGSKNFQFFAQFCIVSAIFSDLSFMDNYIILSWLFQ